MGHHLADGNNKVIGLINNAFVDFHVYGVRYKPLRNLFYITAGNLPDFYDIRPPVVYDKILLRNTASKEFIDFRHLHWFMCPQRGHDVDAAAVLQQIIINRRYFARAGMHSCKVRRNQEHLPQLFFALTQALFQRGPQLFFTDALIVFVL
jgi:hypothetical protein